MIAGFLKKNLSALNTTNRASLLTSGLFGLFNSNNNNKEISTSSSDHSSIGNKESQNKEEMASSSDSWKTAQSVYEFEVKDIDGNLIEMNKYNVACNCGFTAGNYPQMQELHKKYESQGLSVLAFPCNQFGGQEPGAENEIKSFIKQYDVQFEMFSKINVNGDTAHPLYKYLKSKVDGTFGNFIKWNFSKFLVNRQGIPVKRYSPTTEPKDIEKDIVQLLNEKAQL